MSKIHKFDDTLQLRKNLKKKDVLIAYALLRA